MWHGYEGDGPERLSLLDHMWVIPSPIRPQEIVTLGVEPDHRRRAGKIGKMVSSLTILGLVVDDAIHHLDFARIEVTLIVGSIILCIPQGELDG